MTDKQELLKSITTELKRIFTGRTTAEKADIQKEITDFIEAELQGLVTKAEVIDDFSDQIKSEPESLEHGENCFLETEELMKELEVRDYHGPIKFMIDSLPDSSQKTFEATDKKWKEVMKKNHETHIKQELIKMTDDEFMAFMALIMCADPTPLTDEGDQLLKDFADREAVRRGYDNWIVAYHEMK